MNFGHCGSRLEYSTDLFGAQASLRVVLRYSNLRLTPRTEADFMRSSLWVLCGPGNYVSYSWDASLEGSIMLKSVREEVSPHNQSARKRIYDNQFDCSGLDRGLSELKTVRKGNPNNAF